MAEKISEELSGAEAYADLAMKWKPEEPDTADLFFELSTEEMFKKMPEAMNEKHFLATFEIGEDMEEALTDLVEIYFKDVRYKFGKDLYGKTRFLYIIK